MTSQMTPYIFLILVAIPLVCSQSTEGVTPIIRIPGDFDILALLHYRERGNNLYCTGSYNHRVPYDVEALRFAMKNAEMTYFKDRNISLGLTVVDACGNPAVALRDLSTALTDTNDGLPSTGPTIGLLVPGVGGVTKAVYEQISQRLDIPTIGYLPTDPIFLPGEASGNVPTMGGVDQDEQIFLLTSAPPLSEEASVFSKLLKYSEWYNVGVLYSGYGTGPSRKTAFLEQALNCGICVSFERSIPPQLTQSMADQIISDLVDSTEPIEVLVWIVSATEIKMLLRSLRLSSEQFVGVGSSSWARANDGGLLDYYLLEEAENTIYIDDLNEGVNQEFRTYVMELNLTEAAVSNVWLNRTIYEGGPNSKDLAVASHTANLIRAVEMLTRGSTIVLNATCGASSMNVCEDFVRAPNLTIYDAISNKSDKVDKLSTLYKVYLLQNSSEVEVGSLRGDNLTIELDVSFSSYRSDGCMCFTDGLRAIEPSALWLYGSDDPWFIAVFVVSLVFSAVAVLLFFLQLIFCRYPVMKKPAFSANLLLLPGIILMYAMNMFYIHVPNNRICGFRQFGTAFIYAWVFAALLVKGLALVVTIPRQGKYDTRGEKLRKNKLNPCFQLCAFIAFMAPQIALSVQWTVFFVPKTVDNPDMCVIAECEFSNIDIALSMIYIFLLVLVTFVLSLVRIRDANIMQESRSLFLCSLSTAFLLSAWLVCFTIADTVYQIPAICIGVTANATVILLACFTPSCCVLVFGEGTRKQEDEKVEDEGDDIAYVNPAFLNHMDQSTPL